ncbi:MAG: Spo0B domain-containing protein [Syntrophomonas sp.]
MLVALAGSILSFFVRFLPLSPGFNVFIQLPILVLLLYYVCNLPISLALASIIIGFLCVSISEAVFSVLINGLTGTSAWEAMSNPILRVLYPLPEFAFLTAIAVLFKQRGINLINSYKLIIIEGMHNIRIYGKPLFIMGITVFLVVMGFHYQLLLESKMNVTSSNSIPIALLMVIMIGVVLSIILSGQMLSRKKQEQLLDSQQAYISNLQEMMQIIKAQRHDFINHLQVIYGLISLGQTDQVKEYMGRLYKDVQITGDIIHLAIPELSALLLVQISAATARNISFEIITESNLSSLTVPSLELVAVVGNLLNNAMEAVSDLEPERRTVKLKIFEKSGYFIIQTQNPGWIPLEIRDKVFEPGFSTKSETKRGIGLASVKYQVEKYQGLVLLSSHQQRGTRFTICYPNDLQRRKLA